MAEAALVGQSVLSPLLMDGKGMVAGFVIDNPRGPDVRVSLGLLTLRDAPSQQNNALRQVVYDAYAQGLRAVPAMTPLLECVAESATLIVHSDANWEGMRFAFVPVPEAVRPSSNYYASIQGNPLLPDRVSTFTFNGIEQRVVLEQQNKFYLGKDGRWYTTNPLELITHELVHGCGKLQGWSEATERAYRQDLQSGRVPEQEVRAIQFVNETLLEPRGLPGRDPAAYYSAKPDEVRPVEVPPLDAAAEAQLRHGPIPKALQGTTQPRHEAMQPDATSGLPAQMEALQRVLEQSGLCDGPQSVVVARRMAEHVLDGWSVPEQSPVR